MILALIFRLFLGGLFVYAGSIKVLDPGGFAQAVYNYRLLPGWAVNPVAIILPWVEIVTGTCLLLGIWIPGASLLASGLLSLFFLALTSSLARGLDIACGCFSTSRGSETVDIFYILRDLLLLGMAVWVFLFDRAWTVLRSGRMRAREITSSGSLGEK
jgi:uncharacterized membrane protein YphA (DoxX/SURF4 family)